MMLAHIHSTKEKLYGLFNLHVQLNITIGVKKIVHKLQMINNDDFVIEDYITKN